MGHNVGVWFSSCSKVPDPDEVTNKDNRGRLFSDDPRFDVHEELRMYRELFEKLPIAVYIKDIEARFVDVNPFHARALGRDREALIGVSDCQIYPSVEADLYRNADRTPNRFS